MAIYGRMIARLQADLERTRECDAEHVRAYRGRALRDVMACAQAAHARGESDAQVLQAARARWDAHRWDENDPVGGCDALDDEVLDLA